MKMIAEVVIRRLDRGEPQIIHVPWPAELGTYGDRSHTDADMDAWVAAQVAPAIPANCTIVGVCAGRAEYENALHPVIVVTVAAGTGEAILGRRLSVALHGARNTWADGRGGVR